MKNLLLTLGHNSSAIMIEGGVVKWGCETERVSGKKSDSLFPNVVLSHYMAQEKPDAIYVTHWAPDLLLQTLEPKYWWPYAAVGIPVITHTVDSTHHDSHIHAAMCYAGPAFLKRPKLYGLVIDGFGSMGEHLSVYKFEDGRPKLVKRIRGYSTSLGLFYQYATAFMGLKMHEDEYKLLGYEAHVPWHMCDTIVNRASEHAEALLDRMQESVYGTAYDPMFDVKALGNVKNFVFSHLTQICGQFGLQNSHDFYSRSVLAFYVQSVLEQVVLGILKEYEPQNMLLSGGVFYNVKLNRKIMRAIEGQTCVYPLAGDQGNAIGLYYEHNPQFVFPSNLYWGHRTLRDVGRVDGLHIVESDDDAISMINGFIAKFGFVNLVRGSMEFGPRALCNTSTLALPTSDAVKAINAMNERNTVMPMAPVMTRATYHKMFDDANKVWKSEEHMIIALEYSEHPLQEYMGVAHEYLYPYKHHTGRPQVIPRDDTLMNRVLAANGGLLINTSFNFHGQPIAFNMSSIIRNHIEERTRNSNLHTVVITNDN